VIVLALLVGLAIVFLVGHELIEARIFRGLTHQPGLQITIGARRGNLLRGYDLFDLFIKQTAAAPSASRASFATSRVMVRWRLRPFQFTEMSWDPGEIALESPDGERVEIPLGGAALFLDESGWLASGDEVSVGPESWGGSATLQIRADLGEVDGSVRIDRLSGRVLELGGIVLEDFIIPSRVILEMRLTGPPSNMRATGRVSDPATRRSFSF